MTLNAVIRCSSCNRVSPKSGSTGGVCKWCLEIEILNKRLGSNQLSCEKEIEQLKSKLEGFKSELEGFKSEVQDFIEDLIIHGYPIERDEAIKLSDKLLEGN